MTPLSPTEKEQVAELLGLDWGHRGEFKHCLLCEERSPITLEAMFAYCREQKWEYNLSSSGGGIPEPQMTIWNETQRIAWASGHDDTTAVARALLAAKEVGQ